MRKFMSALVVAVMMLGVASAAHAGFGSNLGNSLGNAAKNQAEKAVKGAVMKPSTKCQCVSGAVDSKCAAKLAAEIKGKQTGMSAAGSDHSYWLKCDVHGETMDMANNCVTKLRDTLSAVGASRTSFNPKTKGSEVSCSVELY